MLPSSRHVLVYNIDGLIKGCTKKDISAMFEGMSKKRRILEILDPERDNERERDNANVCTDTVMNKDSITVYAEYKHPVAKIKIKKLDFGPVIMHKP